MAQIDYSPINRMLDSIPDLASIDAKAESVKGARLQNQMAEKQLGAFDEKMSMDLKRFSWEEKAKMREEIDRGLALLRPIMGSKGEDLTDEQVKRYQNTYNSLISSDPDMAKNLSQLGLPTAEEAASIDKKDLKKRLEQVVYGSMSLKQQLDYEAATASAERANAWKQKEYTLNSSRLALEQSAAIRKEIDSIENNMVKARESLAKLNKEGMIDAYVSQQMGISMGKADPQDVDRLRVTIEDYIKRGTMRIRDLEANLKGGFLNSMNMREAGPAAPPPSPAQNVMGSAPGFVPTGVGQSQPAAAPGVPAAAPGAPAAAPGAPAAAPGAPAAAPPQMTGDESLASRIQAYNAEKNKREKNPSIIDKAVERVKSFPSRYKKEISNNARMKDKADTVKESYADSNLKSTERAVSPALDAAAKSFKDKLEAAPKEIKDTIQEVIQFLRDTKNASPDISSIEDELQTRVRESKNRIAEDALEWMSRNKVLSSAVGNAMDKGLRKSVGRMDTSRM